MLLLLSVLLLATAGWAKDIRTVVLTTVPQMHCANCENKIKTNIRFEKGVKEIVTNLKDKTVTVKYDADRTTVEQLVAGFSKIGYQASVVTAGTPAAKGDKPATATPAPRKK